MLYLVIFILFLIFSSLEIIGINHQSSKRLQFFAGFIIVFIAGFRYETGVDWFAYQEYFNKTISLYVAFKSIDFSKVFLSLDVGYCILNATVKMLGGSIQVIYLVISLITTLLLINNLRYYTKYVLTGILIYYCFFFFIFDMSGLRQGLAIQIFLYSLKFIENKNPKKYILCILIATSIHWSSIFLIIFYYFLNKPISNNKTLLIYGFAIIIFIFQINWMSIILKWMMSILSNYPLFYIKFHAHTINVSKRIFDLYSIYNLIQMTLVVTFCYRYRLQLETNSKYHYIFYNLLLLQFFFYFALYEFYTISERFRLFFLISEVVLLANILFILKQKINKQIIFLCCSLILFLNSYPYLLSFPSTCAYNPYQNYLIHKIFNTKSDGYERLMRHKTLHSKK